MTITITVPGTPTGKGRARSATRRKKGGGTYIAHVTPQKTINYESLVALAAHQAMAGRPPLAGAVEVEIAIRITPPGSWSVKKTKQAIEGVIRPITTPDVDNVIKAIFDGCNGIVWGDDRQVTDIARLTKRYSVQPGVVMTVRQATVE